MSANEIILPKDGAPSDPPPAVISSGGVCYEFIEETGDDEDTQWDDVDNTYDNCDECEGFKCGFTWTVDYDCSTESFGTPTLTTTTCDGSCIELDWYYTSIVGDICTYETTICTGDPCDVVGDCTGSTPSVPASPFDCPCVSSSSSSTSQSSSSASPSSSSASPSSSASSSSSASPGPGPQDDGRFI